MTAAAAAGSSAADPRGVAEAVASRCDGAPVTVHETRISLVFLAGERAFKLKKPIVLDFLDYGTADRRRALCHEEVRLNARLGPELYLGVGSVADRSGRLETTDEDDSAAIDYVVEMRRYDEEATLAARLNAGRATGEQMAAVGVSRRWVAAHSGLLDTRAQDGRVREVHGDLRAEHVIVEPRLCVVDCVEFEPALRTLDVADDLAFLVMDLTALGAEKCVAALVAPYRRSGGDCGPDGLLWFFAVHRALIRAAASAPQATSAPSPSSRP